MYLCAQNDIVYCIHTIEYFVQFIRYKYTIRQDIHIIFELQGKKELT